MSRPARIHDALVALLDVALLVLAAYAVSRALKPASTGDVNFVVWLLAGAVLHDVVALPLYTLADKTVRFAVADTPLRQVRVGNFIRFPAAVSLLLFLVYFPTILDENPGNFRRVSGREQATQPGQAWVWITLGLFAASALVLLARAVRRRVR